MLPDPNNQNSIIHKGIRSVAEDKQGAIWIGTVGGLNKLELRDGDGDALQSGDYSLL